MSSSTNSTQRVPAWKRLGLKLKQQPAAAGGTDIGSSGPPSSTPGGSRPNWAGTQNLGVNASAVTTKRKLPENSTDSPPAAASPYKKARTSDAASSATPTLKKQKSVSFAEDTKPGLPALAERNGIKTPSKKQAVKASAPKKQKKSQPEADIKPALAYLKAWKTSRDSWKFNKNHQTLLVKRAFRPDAIPSEDIETFYEYIRDLKGYTRQRLREVAMEVRKEDDAARGKEGFPEGTADPDSKQAEYEALVESFKRLDTGAGGSKRKRFDEVEFVSRNLDNAVTQRVVKRMRAELILEDLSESEDSTDSDAETTTTTETSKTTATSESSTPAPPPQNVARVDERQRLPKLENETLPLPRARRRKVRVMADDTSSDESSSDSDSDSDSESDSGSDASGSGSGTDGSSSDEDGGDSADDDDTSSSDSADSSDEETEAESSEDSSDSEDELPSKARGAQLKKAR
ncbi:hypothetical protein SODALDRAFT_331132 [Sodiomyces alkalinus F11]|uniref:WKF domain-containing protein n=1 Tax=Sodiomyces alkalinus (strain CBS 110278 / VKM F-3762 / F11) TaxID=1314773 RepID=A0A3N2Q3S5_SODAK|nr:hypothetical protein SODALDRAFT_331132 [Sodiomyces alkalinus F11]ROT41409.1 hypothetical protein SODALDRAFT_331132 [Sodiomyces alkalinus F11]